MLTRRIRKKLAVIEYAYINLIKREDLHLSDEQIKHFANEIIYRIHIQGLLVGDTTYTRQKDIIPQGVTWNLENVKTFLSRLKQC